MAGYNALWQGSSSRRGKSTEKAEDGAEEENKGDNGPVVVTFDFP